MKIKTLGRNVLQTGKFAFIVTMLGWTVVQAPAHAVTYVDTMGGENGNERCLIGVGTFGNNVCTGGGTFGEEISIVEMIINDIGLGLTWQRVADPADSIFTFLSDGDTSISVRGRARYAGYNNTFGATVGGVYHELLGTPLAKNTVLQGGDEGNFIALGDTILSLSSGDFWKPTLESGDGNTYTSDPSDNIGGLDHMVAFKTVDPINNPDTDGFSAFRYIIGFEDLVNLGDQDYNDFVVEIMFSAVKKVPEPSTFALFGVGLIGFMVIRRQRIIV